MKLFKEEPRKLEGFNKFMVIYLVTLMLVQFILTVLERRGILLVWEGQGMTLIGGMLFLWSLLGWGAFAIAKRIKHRMAKIIAACGLIFILILVGTFAMSIYGMLSEFSIPKKYCEIKLSTGQSFVVYRTYDWMETQPEEEGSQEAVLEEEPGETDVIARMPEYYQLECVPKKWLIFVDANAKREGGIRVGVNSNATIHYETAAEEDAHKLILSLNNPEPGDSGEIMLTY